MNNCRVKVATLGYFGYKYEIYVLEVPAKNYTVERKYSDFMNLRIILRRSYPGFIVPALPRKAPREFSKEILDQYKFELQKFLDALCSHPLFSSSAILSLFILEKDHNQYEKGKKRICKIEPPRTVAECYTIEGCEKVSFDSLLEEKCSELNESVSSIKSNFQK